MPLEVEVTDEIESLCIYDSWYNEEDDGYERNLEAWLHNVIKVTHEANLSEEKIKTMYFLTPTTSKLTKITNRIWNSMKLNSGSHDDSSNNE